MEAWEWLVPEEPQNPGDMGWRVVDLDQSATGTKRGGVMSQRLDRGCAEESGVAQVDMDSVMVGERDGFQCGREHVEVGHVDLAKQMQGVVGALNCEVLIVEAVGVAVYGFAKLSGSFVAAVIQTQR